MDLGNKYINMYNMFITYAGLGLSVLKPSDKLIVSTL